MNQGQGVYTSYAILIIFDTYVTANPLYIGDYTISMHFIFIPSFFMIIQ